MIAGGASSDDNGRPVDSSRIEAVLVSMLRPHPRNARTHSKKQIRQLADSMLRFGVINPVVVDEQGQIVAGHARVEAVRLLGLRKVPVIKIMHLSELEIRAYMLTDNKLAANAGWDREQLAIEFEELQVALPDIGIDLEITGFPAAEVDLLLADMATPTCSPADDVSPPPAHAVSKLGDLWLMGKHRLLCGDARDLDSFGVLMKNERAAAVFCDPPYNVLIRSVVGRGRMRHREFAAASGEMSSAEYRQFLTTTLGNAARHSHDGAIHYACIDWRHVADLIEVGQSVYGEMLNLVVWNKSNAGQGSFYRSRHELIGVFQVGNGKHRNNIELGRFGRNRSNVWNYGGANTFGAERLEHLAMHPTVKPVAMVADALLDCTVRGDSVLDPFGGSGTLILAAEKVGRRAHVIEIDPRYVDLAITRWQSETKLEATLAGDGRTFEAIGRERFSPESTPRGEDDRPAGPKRHNGRSRGRHA